MGGRAALGDRPRRSRCFTAARATAPTRTRWSTRASGCFGIAQIESPEAVEAVEEIAAVDGIDVLFVGPSDLSFSMGRFRQFDDPEFRSAIERVVAAARDAGKTAGIFLTLARRGAGRARGRLPDDRPRLRRRLHDAGRARGRRRLSRRAGRAG